MKYFVRIISLIFLLPTLFILQGCQRKPASGAFRIKPFGTLPKAANIVVADSVHIMYVKTEADSQTVYLDTIAGPKLEGVYVESSFAFNPKQQRWAYISATNKARPGDCPTCGPPGLWRAVIDGKPGPTYDKVAGVTFSKDGEHVAYAAMKTHADGTKYWVIVEDGQEFPQTFDAVTRFSPQYSPDGRQLASVVRTTDKRSMVVVNGEAGPIVDFIGAGIPLFSPDSKHMAYSAVNYVAHGAHIVFDHFTGPAVDYIPDHSLIFSADSRHFAYAVHTVNDWWAVLDGKPLPIVDEIDNLTFSPDSRHFAYKARLKDHCNIVLDNVKGLSCDSISGGPLVFSPDNQLLAYGYRNAKHWYIGIMATGKQPTTDLADRLRDQEFDNINNLSFSPDSKHLAFTSGASPQKTIVVDGQAGGQFADIGEVHFSPNSKHYGYVGFIRKGGGVKKQVLVLDGDRTDEYDQVLRSHPSGIVYSHDGDNLAYAASIDGKWRLHINKQTSAQTFDAVCTLAPSGRSDFECIAVQGRRLVKVTWHKTD